MSTHEQRIAWEDEARARGVPVAHDERILKALSLGMVLHRRTTAGGKTQSRIGLPVLDDNGWIGRITEDDVTDAYNREGDAQYGLVVSNKVQPLLTPVGRDTFWLNARGIRQAKDASPVPIGNLARRIPLDGLNMLPILKDEATDGRHSRPAGASARLAGLRPPKAAYEALRAATIGLVLVDLTTVHGNERKSFKRHIVPMEIVDGRFEITTACSRFLAHANRKSGFVLGILAEIAPFLVDTGIEVDDEMIGASYRIDPGMESEVRTHIVRVDAELGYQPDHALTAPKISAPKPKSNIIIQPEETKDIESDGGVEEDVVEAAKVVPDAHAAPSPTVAIDATEARSRQESIIAMLERRPYEVVGEEPSYREIAEAIVDQTMAVQDRGRAILLIIAAIRKARSNRDPGSKPAPRRNILDFFKG